MSQFHLPENLIKRASDILSIYESKEKKRDIKIQESLPLDLEEIFTFALGGERSVIEELFKQVL